MQISNKYFKDEQNRIGYNPATKLFKTTICEKLKPYMFIASDQMKRKGISHNNILKFIMKSKKYPVKGI